MKLDIQCQNQPHSGPHNLSPLEQQHTGPPHQYARVLTRFGALAIDVLVLLPFNLPILIFGRTIAEGEGEAMSEFGAVVLILAVFGILVFGAWTTIVCMGRTGQCLCEEFQTS